MVYCTLVTPLPSLVVPLTIILALETLALLLGLVIATIGAVVSLNVAVTDLLKSMVTVHAPVPVHAPPQPSKVDPLEAVAVRLTLELLAKLAMQVDPQSIPVGSLVTFPKPEPTLLTLKLPGNGVYMTVREALPSFPAGSVANTWMVLLPGPSPYPALNCYGKEETRGT